MRIWEAEEERRGPDSGGQVDGGQETDPRDIRLRQSLVFLCTILEVWGRLLAGGPLGP